VLAKNLVDTMVSSIVAVRKWIHYNYQSYQSNPAPPIIIYYGDHSLTTVPKVSEGTKPPKWCGSNHNTSHGNIILSRLSMVDRTEYRRRDPTDHRRRSRE